MGLKRVGRPGWRDRSRALVACFGIRWLLSKCRCMQARRQDNRNNDSHRFILPRIFPESYLIHYHVTLALVRSLSTGFC